MKTEIKNHKYSTHDGLADRYGNPMETIGDCVEEMNELLAELVAMREQNAYLRSVIQPFANEGAKWKQTAKSRLIGICELGFDPVEAEFTADDLCEAVIAMANKADITTCSQKE